MRHSATVRRAGLGPYIGAPIRTQDTFKHHRRHMEEPLTLAAINHDQSDGRKACDRSLSPRYEGDRSSTMSISASELGKAVELLEEGTDYNALMDTWRSLSRASGIHPLVGSDAQASAAPLGQGSLGDSASEDHATNDAEVDIELRTATREELLEKLSRAMLELDEKAHDAQLAAAIGTTLLEQNKKLKEEVESSRSGVEKKIDIRDAAITDLQTQLAEIENIAGQRERKIAELSEAMDATTKEYDASRTKSWQHISSLECELADKLEAMEQLSHDNKQLSKKLADLEGRLSSSADLYHVPHNQNVNKWQKQCENLKDTVDALKGDIAELQRTEADNAKERDELRKQLAERHAAVKDNHMLLQEMEELKGQSESAAIYRHREEDARRQLAQLKSEREELVRLLEMERLKTRSESMDEEMETNSSTLQAELNNELGKEKEEALKALSESREANQMMEQQLQCLRSQVEVLEDANGHARAALQKVTKWCQSTKKLCDEGRKNWAESRAAVASKFGSFSDDLSRMAKQIEEGFASEETSPPQRRNDVSIVGGVKMVGTKGVKVLKQGSPASQLNKQLNEIQWLRTQLALNGTPGPFISGGSTFVAAEQQKELSRVSAFPQVRLQGGVAGASPHVGVKLVEDRRSMEVELEGLCEEIARLRQEKDHVSNELKATTIKLAEVDIEREDAKIQVDALRDVAKFLSEQLSAESNKLKLPFGDSLMEWLSPIKEVIQGS